MKARLNIALVAHDSRKTELIDWVRYNASLLSKHNLYATGTTGKLISELEIPAEDADGKPVMTTPFKDKVTRLLSGPLGGDQQIGALVATEQVHCVIFLRDPLTSQPHEPDINAPLRRSQYPTRDESQERAHSLEIRCRERSGGCRKGK